MSTDANFMTVCIKVQSGELSHTSDIVFLPPIVIKNVLPCLMELQYQSPIALDKMQLDDYDLNIFTIEKSQSKAFYRINSSESNN